MLAPLSGVARFSQHMLATRWTFFFRTLPLEQIPTPAFGCSVAASLLSDVGITSSISIRQHSSLARMTHDQLAAYSRWPHVHVPSDGNPLKGYALPAASKNAGRYGDGL